MSRIRTEQTRGRQRSISYRIEFNQEIDQRMAQLRERVADIRDLKVEGFPYKDSERVRLELRVRQAIRQAFGDESPEYQKHQYFRLKGEDLDSTIAVLEELIGRLDKQKFDLPDGGAPAPVPSMAPVPIAAEHEDQPLEEEHELTTDREVAPNSHVTDSRGDRPMIATKPRAEKLELVEDARGEPHGGEHEPALAAIRKLCTGFHAVARQLRQRHDDRPTLDVEDEHDVQDLLHALLRLEFQDIRTERWMPGYAGGQERTTFLFGPQRLALVIKRTKPGLGGREIKQQLDLDMQRYSGRPDCQAFLCFVYDPEGRIANPRELEASLTRTDETGCVVVHISP
jgi:hypothetical protein